MNNEYTYDENIFSDLYKDANGFRPRSHEFYHEGTTDARKQEIWDATLNDLDEEMKYQEQRQAQAVVDFEALIKQTIAHGASDKISALKWLRQAEDDCHYEFDDGYFEYTHGIPYGYLKENGYVS